MVAVPAGFEPYSIPWQEHTTYIGRAVGLDVQAEQLVTGTEAVVTDAAAANPGLAGNTAQVRPSPCSPSSPRCSAGRWSSSTTTT